MNNNTKNRKRKHVIVCKNCNELYYSVYKTTKFCGDKCRGKFNKKNRGIKQTCIRCKRDFFGYQINEHCTKECQQEGQRETKERNKLIGRLVKAIDPNRQKNCKGCNKLFYASYIGREYCSGLCHYDNWYSSVKVNRKVYDKKCIECNDNYSTTRPKSRYCSETCRKKSNWRKNEVIRNDRLKKNGKIDWDISLDKLMIRDKGICYLCNSIVGMDEHHNHNLYGSIDHVIPVSKGGTHTWDNVRLAHRICNTIKSDEITI